LQIGRSDGIGDRSSGGERKKVTKEIDAIEMEKVGDGARAGTIIEIPAPPRKTLLLFLVGE
jgi:hypothetical protein